MDNGIKARQFSFARTQEFFNKTPIIKQQSFHDL